MKAIKTALLTAGGLWASVSAAYASAFCTRPSRFADAHALPEGEQFRPESARMHALISELEGILYEPVEIISHDGLRLRGRYYHVRSGAPVQLPLHGYHRSPMLDFCGGNRIAREAGQNTLLVWQRAHGDSEGSTISLGIRERRDCADWAWYLRMRFGAKTPIFIAGVSMGAATALMASELELPETVKGIIADCPYSSPRAIIRKVLDCDLRLPGAAVLPLVEAAARLYGGFSFGESAAISAAGRSRVPILLLHGEDDRFVPCDMSRAIKAASGGRAELVTFPKAGHALSFIADEAGYADAVNRFISDCLA